MSVVTWRRAMVALASARGQKASVTVGPSQGAAGALERYPLWMFTVQFPELSPK
jgi:hypothetical protein